MKKYLIALLLAFGLASSVFADGQPQEFRHFDNFGGLNTKDSSILIADNESPDCQNVFFTTKGAIVKRNGYDRLNETGVPATPDQITSLYQYNQDDGDTFFIATAGAKVYKMESLDKTWDDITGAATITADNKWKWITVADTLWGTNDVNPPLKWTGTGDVAAATVPTGVTTARDIVEYRNYYIYLNVTLDGTKQPSRFYYSDLKDFTTFNALSFVDIAPSDGDIIIGAVVLGSDLYVYKEKAVYQVRLTGDAVSPFVVKKTNSHVGSVSTHGIINVNNTILFPSFDGFYGFNGNQSVKLSDKIDPTFATITRTQLENIVISHYLDASQVWWSVADGSTNDTILIWDYSNNAWTKYSGINAAYLATYFDSGDEKIFHGDYAGIVFEDDKSDSDDGSGIDAYWTSKWFDFGQVGINKRVQNLVFVTDDSGNYNLQVGYAYDFGPNNERTLSVDMSSEGSLWDSAIWDSAEWGGRSLLIHRLNLVSQGRFWNVQFKNDQAEEPFTVYGYSALVRPMGGF